jgi:hypothetical protein
MRFWARTVFLPLPLCGLLASCGGSSDSPTAPSEPQSFLVGTWQGSVTIQINPGDPGAPAPSSGNMTWAFEVVPQTNRQAFRATVQSAHAWLPINTIATTTIIPVNTPPAQISTQGSYDSPRGCRGTFASFGVSEATRIDADFTGVDCNNTTFSGRVILTKR